MPELKLDHSEARRRFIFLATFSLLFIVGLSLFAGYQDITEGSRLKQLADATEQLGQIPPYPYSPELLDSVLASGYRVLIVAFADWDTTAVVNLKKNRGRNLQFIDYKAQSCRAENGLHRID